MLLRAQGRAALPTGDTEIQPGELANRAWQRGRAFPLLKVWQLTAIPWTDGALGDAVNYSLIPPAHRLRRGPNLLQRQEIE